jgi:hypothetical protein
MKMLKDEIKDAVQTWPANARAPLTREQQILLMTTARERHSARVERFDKMFKENKMS